MLDRLKGFGAQQKLAMALAKEKISVEAGDGAVKLTINGAMQVQNISLDRSKINPEDLSKLEKWLESAFNQAVRRSMEAMADKAKSAGISGL